MTQVATAPTSLSMDIDSPRYADVDNDCFDTQNNARILTAAREALGNLRDTDFQKMSRSAVRSVRPLMAEFAFGAENDWFFDSPAGKAIQAWDGLLHGDARKINETTANVQYGQAPDYSKLYLLQLHLEDNEWRFFKFFMVEKKKSHSMRDTAEAIAEQMKQAAMSGDQQTRFYVPRDEVRHTKLEQRQARTRTHSVRSSRGLLGSEPYRPSPLASRDNSVRSKNSFSRDFNSVVESLRSGDDDEFGQYESDEDELPEITYPAEEQAKQMDHYRANMHTAESAVRPPMGQKALVENMEQVMRRLYCIARSVNVSADEFQTIAFRVCAPVTSEEEEHDVYGTIERMLES
eukprot:Clim_evm8s53 gene=Clim_evmTU8s53